MFDLKISSFECTYMLPSGRIIRTVASYDIDERTLLFGNWNGGDSTLRPKDDALRESNPEVAMLSPLYHEIVHDVLHLAEENSHFDILFYEEKLQDDLGLPDWKPCGHC